MSRVGIITWHYYSNFGSVLQSYALQEAIRQLGHDVEIVNYRNTKFGNPQPFKEAVRLILHSSLGRFFRRYRFHRIHFLHKYLRMGKPVADESLLPALTRKFDVIVCGSDQIWAPNCYNPVYFASFARRGVRKVSYAASIGLDDIPPELASKYREHLADFHAVSVREAEGKRLLAEKCCTEATVVLDPTLLHDATFYTKVEEHVEGFRDGFLFCYFLAKDHNYRERVEAYASRHGLQIVGVSDREADDLWMKRLEGLHAGHFVWLIHHARAVMTDSYHGTILSLIFHKPSLTFIRFASDSPICQNSRIRQLQDYFGDDVHLIGQAETIPENNCSGFGTFDSRLPELRRRSILFLKNNLR